MRVFKDLDLVEQLGSGIPRIVEIYGKDCFKFSDNFLRMTFPKIEDTANNYGGAKSGAKSGAKEILTDRQQEVLDFILNKPDISYREVAEKLSVNPSAAQKHFDTLKNKGVITRKGSTRGIWEVGKNYIKK